MGFESLLREDFLGQQYFDKPRTLTIEKFSSSLYQNIVSQSIREIPRTVSPEPAKNIIEVMDLIYKAIQDYETRTHVTEDGKINFTYESPDVDINLETISIELTRRSPGMFGKGRPFENDIKQLRPLCREEKEDLDNPGYRRVVLGYWYDNILTLTCWARTNKQANERALWLENVMEEYTWFFVYSGAGRVLYQGRKQEKVREVNNQKIYGRPIDYFVRTEKLRSVSQKELEQICLRLGVTKA